MNRSAMRLFSLNSSNLYNTSIYELMPDELEKYFTPGKETTGISVSFGTEELLLSISSVEDYFLLIFNNVTKKQRIKYKLDLLHERLRTYDTILDRLEEGICVIDEDLKILFYNKKMGEINLREPESIKNKNLFEAFPNLEEDNSKLLKTLKLQKTLNHRETHFKSDGKEVTILSKTYPLMSGTKKMGAVEILKDITKQKELEDTIRRLKNNNDAPMIQLNDDQPSNNTRFQFKNIVFQSREMGRIIELAKRAASSPSNVLIIGETGTGKELFAQSIHNESPRSEKPFIAQNCAALPKSLLEGLLFGTSVGSFTGAVERSGIFEQAHKGTLLLDEINSMGVSLQAKLLRVLQEKKVRRLGSNKEIDADVRIVATLNEDPQEAIQKGRLREDLYYRLGVVNLVIQPLRKRKTDLTVLMNHFIEKHSKALNIQIDGVQEDVAKFFQEYSWPGNTRQLEHTIEGALNLINDEKIITFDHLPYTFQQQMLEEVNTQQGSFPPRIPNTKTNGTLTEQLEHLEINLIKEAINESYGNITKASNKLGISRQNLNYKLKKFNIATK
ncbi:sigma-54 interaction domain-containing protein [Virgibacillus sp. W0181]|uniref:sigma-54 interaction domain-containing protein n=1 Tax=Virgibacillus sp. W0181 TaxID=3391581 RepID=UPI003F455F74